MLGKKRLVSFVCIFLIICVLLALSGNDQGSDFKPDRSHESPIEDTPDFKGSLNQQTKVNRPEPVGNTTKVNAAFVMLCRESDLSDVLSSLRGLESRFNQKFKYPYVFINNDNFSDNFKQRVKEAISTTAARYLGISFLDQPNARSRKTQGNGGQGDYLRWL